jgi:hypothetical protein
MTSVPFSLGLSLWAAPRGRPLTPTTNASGRIRHGLPDFTIDDEIAEGDRVVHRTTARGTMMGDFQGMSASSTTATWSEIHITRFETSKAVEHWGVVEQLGMLARLGFAQAPGQPAEVAG